MTENSKHFVLLFHRTKETMEARNHKNENEKLSTTSLKCIKIEDSRWSVCNMK
jgi:hypothetical protein